ncbi:MAG: DUF2092 domain-containing protein [Planctomycetota bacterium]|jgi:hypothetical protein
MTGSSVWCRRKAILAGFILIGCAGAISASADGLQETGAASASAQATGGRSRVEPRADRVLREMSEYLGTAREFTFHADVTYDVVPTRGPMVQYGGTADLAVRRPDRMYVNYSGDRRRSRAYIDGRTFTFYGMALNVYATTEVPAGLDAAIDHVFETFGVSVPIADLVYSDPYAILTENAESGFWVGRHPVDGTPCHHLAFSQETIDWQIWIEDGPRPVPRKLVVTHKLDPGAPQYTARLTGWDLQPRLSDHCFQFDPPVGADRIEFLPAPEMEIEP